MRKIYQNKKENCHVQNHLKIRIIKFNNNKNKKILILILKIIIIDMKNNKVKINKRKIQDQVEVIIKL